MAQAIAKWREKKIKKKIKTQTKKTKKPNKSKYTNIPSTDNNTIQYNTTHPSPVPRSPSPNDGDGRQENLAVSGAEAKSSYYL